MGLLSKLLSRPPAVTKVEATLYEGAETLEVVGESHHQETLWRLVGGHREDYVRVETIALLVPERDNPYDRNAVKVLIKGLLVGRLSREDAAAYGPGLSRLIEKSAGGLVALQAVIAGGGEREDGIGFLGDFLEHDPADFGLAPHPTRGHGIRTGLSEAIAHDLDDDRYDLSWLRELSSNDVAAIKQLRAKLAKDGDPIDRHYQFCELEHRLYRSRDAFTSALEEFDEVCRAHDAEMEVIRPALLETFGGIPVIDTYRQEVIRAKKAKDWVAMRDWAERGLSIYGDDAVRDDAIDDLRERLAYATAKLEAGEPARTPRVAIAPGSRAVEMETLVCTNCGRSFERARTTGRKPHACPSCRNAASGTTTLAP